MKSDLEFAIESSKKLESILERNFGATGRGLHEKIDSVSNRLAAQVIRDLRYVATIRNKIVHEEMTSTIDDRTRFASVVQTVVAALQPVTPQPSQNRTTSSESSHVSSEASTGVKDARFIGSLVVGLSALLLAAWFKISFIVGLLIGAIGFFVGYALGPFICAALGGILLLGFIAGLIWSAFWLLRTLYDLVGWIGGK